MKEKNKGFTLVELLAVIVILALIALIATPIILNVINDAKKQAAKDSAYGYMDAVEKYIVSSELEDKSIKDGTYRVEDLNKKISVKGSTPDNGTIKIENKEVKNYDIGIDGYAVSNGEVEKVSTTKKFENGTAVYYNPVSGKKCTGYTETNSTKETKSGCMKWYVFNDKEGNATVNVIVDHNTTAEVAWNLTGNNSEMKEVKIKLENDTKDWKNTARLITASEIAKITGNTGFDTSKNQDWFCLDTNKPDTANWCAKSQGTSEYDWLFDYTYDCTNYGCNISDSNTWGYWTSSPDKGNSAYAWRVRWNGNLLNGVVGSTDFGIRPVITISKSNIE